MNIVAVSFSYDIVSWEFIIHNVRLLFYNNNFNLKCLNSLNIVSSLKKNE